MLQQREPLGFDNAAIAVAVFGSVVFGLFGSDSFDPIGTVYESLISPEGAIAFTFHWPGQPSQSTQIW